MREAELEDFLRRMDGGVLKAAGVRAADGDLLAVEGGVVGVANSADVELCCRFEVSAI